LSQVGQVSNLPLHSIGRSTTTDLNGSRFGGEWSTGVLKYWVLKPSLHYSTTPLFQSLEKPLLFQLTRDALVDDIFDFELANLLVAST